jgi:alanine dehydrogenase
MVIGVPKEIKPEEYRVALTPAGAETLSLAGHDVVLEEGAGLGSGFTDDYYEKAGATVLSSAEEVWAKAPNLIQKEDLALMPAGTVIVDVAVDQGGCVETIKPTTHHDPVYTVDGVIHYAVANMPGGVPRTSTLALTNAMLPYATALAGKGWVQAGRDDEALRLGVNIVDGQVTYQAVGEAFGIETCPVDDFLSVGA